jgi:hypothetical protein
MPDSYQILGVTEKSSKTEIKSAFRRLAKQYHPDLNKTPGAVIKFRELNVAYNEVLQKAPDIPLEAVPEAPRTKVVWASWTSGMVWVATVWLSKEEALCGDQIKVKYRKRYGEGESSFRLNIPAGVTDYQFLECTHNEGHFNFIIAIA